MLSVSTHVKAQLLLTAKRNVMLRHAGDVAGHEFHGNQWTQDSGDPRHQQIQMTRDAYYEAFMRGDPTISVQTSDGRLITPESKGPKYHTDAKHEKLVKEALAAGLSVPAHVLADYAHLTRVKPKWRHAGDVLGHEFHGNQWTQGTTSETGLKALAKMPLLKGYEDKNIVANPIINVKPKDRAGYISEGREAIQMASDGLLTERGVEKLVPLSKIDSGQIGVTRTGVEKYLKGARSGDPIMAIEGFGGRYWIVDGNHRVAAAKLSGAKTIQLSIHTLRR